MTTSPRKEKFTLCNITTTNRGLVERSDKLRANNKDLTHEMIYQRGLEAFEQERKTR